MSIQDLNGLELDTPISKLLPEVDVMRNNFDVANLAVVITNARKPGTLSDGPFQHPKTVKSIPIDGQDHH